MKIVIDLDDTLTISSSGEEYENKAPNVEVIERLREYRSKGFYIAIYSSRNMRTYQGSIGHITVHTVPTILDWLRRHDVPHDELIVGKPWCGPGGFYVDDKAIRPNEFVSLSYEEILQLVGTEAPV